MTSCPASWHDHQEKPPKLISDNFGKKNKRNRNPIISIK
jgi:hypothetical protein